MLVINNSGYLQSNKLLHLTVQPFGSALGYTSIAANNDSSIIIGGLNYYTNGPVVCKIDNNNNIIWSKIFETNNSSPIATQLTKVELYNEWIYTLLYTHTDTVRYQLTKLDLNGAPIWSRSIVNEPYTYYDTPSISVDPTGNINLSSSIANGIQLYQFSSDGNLNWAKNFSTEDSSIKNPNFDIISANNGDILGCAKANSDISIYRFNSSGNLLWVKTLNESSAYNHAKSIIQITDSTFLICGQRYNNELISGGFFAIIDNVGNFNSFKFSPDLPIIRSAMQLSSGNVILSSIDYLNRWIIIEIDAQGEIISSHLFPNILSYAENYNLIANSLNCQYYATSVGVLGISNLQNYDCSIVEPINIEFLDETITYPAESSYISYSSTPTNFGVSTVTVSNANLEILMLCETMIGFEDNTHINLKIYPTILRSSEELKIEHDYPDNISYSILDINGKKILNKTLYENKIQIENLNPGIYFIQLSTVDRIVQTSKFVVTN